LVYTKFLPILLGLSGVFLFCGCQNKDIKEDPKNAVAFYAYSAGPYSETVTLWPSGKYLQTLTQKAYKPYLPDGQVNIIPGMAKQSTVKRTGTWHLLDKLGGTLLALPASASALPKNAVVEIKRALPFGLTYENQSVFQVDRTIPISEFSIKKQ
jgi:hypothetical protein